MILEEQELEVLRLALGDHPALEALRDAALYDASRAEAMILVELRALRTDQRRLREELAPLLELAGKVPELLERLAADPMVRALVPGLGELLGS